MEFGNVTELRGDAVGDSAATVEERIDSSAGQIQIDMYNLASELSVMAPTVIELDDGDHGTYWSLSGFLSNLFTTPEGLLKVALLGVAAIVVVKVATTKRGGN